MTTAPLPWPQIKAVFDAAVDLPAANRETLIAAAALDAAALAELRSLLAHHDVATEQQVFMAETAAQQLAEAAARVGQRLGAWEIVRAIGSGGMGEVFEASRADGSYQGRAAVKLLKRGMDSAAVLQRFALERQALARLSHPHIARLLDAGASDEGLPYFVLEYVDGQAIDEAVRSLSIDARLRLFLQLADAVSHAHRNLLVHRDLKPGNVLVDSEGQVKLLDFGIAKALDPLEGHDGQTTVGGQRPYTPHYASPEQVRGEPVTTATDIYSLGVLLYQMLTGTRPTGRHATTPAEAARSVLEDEPTRPSRLSPSEAVDPQWLQTRKRLEGDLDNILLKALEKAADRRYASVDALAADVLAYLQGRPVRARPAQLGYVLGKFVRRNRWAVVAGALGGLGLLAGLAAALLQGRVAMVVGLLGMALGLGLALLQAERARRAQRSAAEQLGHVKDLLRGLVLRYSYGVWLTPKGGRLMRAFVEDALPRLERALQAAPHDLELRAIAVDLYSRLGEMLGSHATAIPAGAAMGQPDPGAVTAQRACERAVALGDEVLAAGPHEGQLVTRIATARITLAAMAQQAHEPLKGLAQLQAALAQVDTALLQPQPRAAAAQLRSVRGHVLMSWGQLCDHGGNLGLDQPEQALELLAQAQQEFDRFLADAAGIAALTAASPEDDIDATASVLQNQGSVHSSTAMVHLKQGRISAAQAQAQQALQMHERLLRDFPPNVVFSDGLVSAANLATHLSLRCGLTDLAVQVGQRGWQVNTGLIASEGADSKWAAMRPILATEYGAALQAAGRWEQALPVLREGAAHWQLQAEAAPGDITAGRSRRRSALCRLNEARARRALGDSPQALAAVQAGIAVLAPAAADPRQGAETRLAQAELHLLRAELGAPSAAQDRALVRDVALGVLSLPMLAPDHRQLAQQLAQKPAQPGVS
ncbi:MAG: serine/threonine-protein kinase [Rubrivivax sp.]|nr:serine/threonine-protein kinase [Rubrivivax sp.]